MKIRSLILILMCALLLAACGKGDAAVVETTAAPTAEVQTVTEAPATPAPVRERQVVVVAATDAATEVPAVTAPPTPEPTQTPEPTPEPTATPAPMLGVLDAKFADKFVTGAPVLTDTADAKSYQSERVAIFITRVVDDSKTLTNHTFNYFIADVYLQNMEDLKSGAAKSWSQKWDNAMLVDVAKKHEAVFAVSGDFTLTRKEGLVTRNGEVLRTDHDEKRDVGVIYLDGHMETYTANTVPVEELTHDPNVWQILGFGPELLDGNGQPKTEFNDPNKVGAPNIRNAVGYFEPGHFCFVYVQPYKKLKDGTCLDMASLSQLMHDLGCARAYNLDGGGTAGMYFNGKLVSDKGLGPTRKLHDIYYIPAV